MSMINDALQRTKEAQNAQPSTPPPLPAMIPVMGKSPARSNWPVVVLALGLFLLFGLAGWFIVSGLRFTKESRALAVQAAEMARYRIPGRMPRPEEIADLREAMDEAMDAFVDSTAKPPPSSPSNTSSNVGSPITAKSKDDTAAPVAANTTPVDLQSPAQSKSGLSPKVQTAVVTLATNPPANASAANARSAVTKPAAKLRLQGIFYQARNASAIINSKTVMVGDSVDGMEVVAIERDKVLLALGGQTNTLTLR